MKPGLWVRTLAILILIAFVFQFGCRREAPQKPSPARALDLPSSKKLMLPVPGHPQSTNSFPTAAALSPDGNYLAVLNNGYGTEGSHLQQSIAILDLNSNRVTDFPDSRLGGHAEQTYFLGLAFSRDGTELYASMASRTDPTGEREHDTGNGIAVYQFERGRLTPQSFIKLPLAPLAAGKKAILDAKNLPDNMTDPYPAGLSVLPAISDSKLLVAENLADDAVLLDRASGRILERFPLSTDSFVPAAYPYGVIETRDGKTGFCSLWNASKIAQLNLQTGKVVRMISLLAPQSPTAPGSHPTAMLLSPDERYLYVTLTNADQVAVVDVQTGQIAGLLSTELPEEKYGGTSPDALAQTPDGSRLFVADASADAVAVFDMSHFASRQSNSSTPEKAVGFIPTEWYPTSLAVKGDSLLIVTGKGEGTGPNGITAQQAGGKPRFRYIATLIHGSVARVSIRNSEDHLAELTRLVERSNLMEARTDQNRLFAGRSNPIRHVIYVIKENRTYDQIFGDLKPGNGDPSLCMFGEDVTPNEHALAKQFGIIDNFYCSGEVSGDGHDWSTAAITSDYNEKTWEISYRGREGTGAFGGVVFETNPLLQGIPDVDDPGTGFIWADVARHGLTHRNYGEFIITHWCDKGLTQSSLRAGVPLAARGVCREKAVSQGQPLPPNVGEPHGSPSPWPWPVPLIAYDEATKPALENHFDPHYADFRLDYPDQLRIDEFLDEFKGYVHARETGHGTELPQSVIMWLPDDHTAGTKPGMPTPAASVADNDLAVGRLAEAVSHSPYWSDTAIFILEDDAQNGPDHVDAHRSTALVISKYSPGAANRPFVDHHFYTTVNMVHTIEELLGLPPMNNNDAQAPVMTPLFSGPGNQPPFTADTRNRQNRLICTMNPPHGPGARQSARMDFSHADRANADVLNAILWRERMGNTPMPKPRHVVFR